MRSAERAQPRSRRRFRRELPPFCGDRAVLPSGFVAADTESYVAECFWPDVDDADLAALEQRIERIVADPSAGRMVRYLGSILLREDEVVLCRFEGAAEHVRDVAEQAEIPFERILAAAHSPWPLSAARCRPDRH